MKRTIPRWLLMIFLLIITQHSYAQSNKGTEFWTAWMEHIDGASSTMSLYLTSDVNTNATVSLADGSFSQTYAITANAVTIVDIPPNAYLNGEGQTKRGIHIVADKNIVVYAHIYHSNRSGATLVLPVNAMGKDYYSINYTQKSGTTNGNTGRSTFCVIATENNTTVEITPSAALLSGHAANVPFTVLLQKGEVYQGLSATDLTGTHIKSISTPTEPCKKIAVYSGSSWIAINCNIKSGAKTSADNLFQQAYPTSTWGKNYISVPLSGRDYDVIRIIVSDPSAVVTFNGATANSLQNNLYYDYSSRVPAVITSDKPIQVAQYAVTQGAGMSCNDVQENVGDPEMIFLSPIEQGLEHVTLYSTDKQNITQSYINVIIPTSATQSFTIDGQNNNQSSVVFRSLQYDPTHSYAQIPVTSGATHNLNASAPFSAVAYGWGNVESYGYTAGTDLKNLNETIVFENKQTNTTGTNGCAGVTYTPQITLPYQTNSITWDLQDGTAVFTDANPTVTSSEVKNGVTLYTYTASKTATYTTGGDYNVKATVFNPTADDCGSNQDVDIDFTVSDLPDVKFTATPSVCLADGVTFTDQTDNKGVNIKSWLWDFGDGQTATTQNATHIYTAAGDYNVTLTTVNTNGCNVTSAIQTVHINAPPQALFNISTPDCETRNITFTDQSTSIGNPITQWTWDFGDGSTPVTNNTNVAVTHQFATAGTYTVSLQVTNSAGCISNLFTKNVIISPLPQVDFVLPDVCLSDAFAQFNDKSTIADNSEAQFTYAWNFGDPNATVANPNTSTLKNPKHTYTQVSDVSHTYNVTLTVTSKNGCTVTKSQSFIINGGAPKAVFSVENPNNFCSSEDVIFDDLSSVNFGNVTKLVWYFDYINHPTDATIYTKDQFTPDKKYHHNYGLFYTPASRNYTVRLEAYSGANCVSVSSVQVITVKANPSVTLSQIGTICQDAGPIQITETVNNGAVGTSTFSGPGVSPTGLFDPSVSGNGNFVINYTFTANNGCDYNATQNITVNPVPKASAGPDLHILEGGSATIDATASGVEPLTYKWTLADGSIATGLNHDDVLHPLASPAADIVYMLTVTSAEGCSISSTVNVFVLKAPEIPTAFTPNTDGVNDTWNIKYLDSYPNCTVNIYNRYGEKLYSSNGYPVPWDGTYQGKMLPTGTYYYVINPKNGRQVMSGSVTIIR